MATASSSKRRKFVTILLALLAAVLTIAAVIVAIAIQRTQAPDDTGAVIPCTQQDKEDNKTQCISGKEYVCDGQKYIPSGETCTTGGNEACGGKSWKYLSSDCIQVCSTITSAVFTGVSCPTTQIPLTDQTLGPGTYCGSGAAYNDYPCTQYDPKTDPDGGGVCGCRASHLECRDNACRAVAGAGSNTCSTNADCAPAAANGTFSLTTQCAASGPIIRASWTPATGQGSQGFTVRVDTASDFNGFWRRQMPSSSRNVNIPVDFTPAGGATGSLSPLDENTRYYVRVLDIASNKLLTGVGNTNTTLSIVTTNCPVCGDGNVDTGEQCDDGNTNNSDSCNNSCTTTAPVCGNGTVDAGEQCDPAANPTGCSTGVCSNTCTCGANTCGNGTVDPGEQCDDGNTNDNDGCSSTCTTEGNAGEVEVDPVCQGNQSQATITWTSNDEGVRVQIDDDATFPNDDGWWVRIVESGLSVTAPTGFFKGTTPLTFVAGQTYYVRVYNEETESFTNTVSFVASDCSDNEGPTCGDSCTSDSQCPNNHTCNNGTCILDECVGNSACTNNGCNLPLPDTALVSDEADRLILAGLLLVIAGMMVYRFRLADFVLGSVIESYDSQTKIRSSRSEFEERVTKRRKG